MTMKLATDWLSIGPLVGFTNQHSTRIVAKPLEHSEGPFELRLARTSGRPSFDAEVGAFEFEPSELAESVRKLAPTRSGEFGTLVFEVDDLQAGARYFYEVVPVGAGSHEGGFASDRPFSFRTLPEQITDVRFSFHSCNGLHKPPRGGKPAAMWTRLLAEVMRREQVHVAILGGDQIYADVIREKWLRRWEPDFDPYAERVFDWSGAKACRAFLEDLPRRYEQIYKAFWRRPEIRAFMGHIPCVATWDDHEIYDGWGSHGNEHLPAQQAFFKAASRSFDAFQHALNPSATFSSEAAQHRAGHRAFSFRIGDTAFVVTDSRSARNIASSDPSALLGSAQWAWLDAELDALEQAPPRQLVVVTAVPVVHMSGALEAVVPGSAELHDDVLDHWSSRPNLADQGRLLGRLFQVRRATGCNVLLLGGDVHVATVGRIVSRESRFLLPNEAEACIHQGVSSAIAYESPQGFTARLLAGLIRREHPLRGPFVGRVDEVVTSRNFSIIDASGRENRTMRFTLYSEQRDVPDQYYFGLHGQ